MSKDLGSSLVVDDTFIYGMADRFKELRLYHGYTLTDLADKLRKNFQFEINDNLLGKIERKESKLQLNQFLVLAAFYRLEIGDFFTVSYAPAKEPSTKYALEYSRNPDFKWISDLLLDRASDYGFLNFVKSVLKGFDLYFDTLQGKTDLMKAASKKK